MAAPQRAAVTVQEMKAILNAIPGGAQSALVIPPADGEPLPVVTGYEERPDGVFYTVIGYIDFVSKSYIPL